MMTFTRRVLLVSVKIPANRGTVCLILIVQCPIYASPVTPTTTAEHLGYLDADSFVRICNVFTSALMATVALSPGCPDVSAHTQAFIHREKWVTDHLGEVLSKSPHRTIKSTSPIVQPYELSAVHLLCNGGGYWQYHCCLIHSIEFCMQEGGQIERMTARPQTTSGCSRIHAKKMTNCTQTRRNYMKPSCHHQFAKTLRVLL